MYETRRRSASPLAAVTVALAAGAAPLSPPAPASAQRPAVASAPCEEAEGFDRLDFWLGEWDVMVGEERVGTNRIKKILAGCAVMEHWTDRSGGQGKSLFFYTPVTDAWRQVWVTQDATRPGGVKEKTLIAVEPGGAVRFQGEIALPDGGSYLDRTTLTPTPDGTVRQLIEVSRDGASWTPTFDALYVPAEGSEAGSGAS